jgi:hypothetical protein
MKKLSLSIMLSIGILTSAFSYEILDVEITKIENYNKRIDSLSKHDFNIEFLYDNMVCDAEMSFDLKKTYISSNAFFCKTSDYSRLYHESPRVNKKYEYVIINKKTGLKVSDLNSIEISNLTIQKNLVQ